jgi:hypothetical protein
MQRLDRSFETTALDTAELGKLLRQSGDRRCIGRRADDLEVPETRTVLHLAVDPESEQRKHLVRIITRQDEDSKPVSIA